jgi:hypothetical protein
MNDLIKEAFDTLPCDQAAVPTMLMNACEKQTCTSTSNIKHHQAFSGE